MKAFKGQSSREFLQGHYLNDMFYSGRFEITDTLTNTNTHMHPRTVATNHRSVMQAIAWLPLCCLQQTVNTTQYIKVFVFCIFYVKVFFACLTECLQYDMSIYHEREIEKDQIMKTEKESEQKKGTLTTQLFTRIPSYDVKCVSVRLRDSDW